MFHQLSFVVLLLAVGQFADAQHFSLGKCPKVNVLKEFDLGSYVGLWYQYGTFPFIHESNLKCSQAQYGSLGDNTVSVLNTGINKSSGQPVSIKGFAKVLGPAKLAVVFFPGQSETKANYLVLGTDYKTYAVVYSCDQILFGKAEFLYVLTRDRTPSQTVINAALNVVKSNGISTEYIETQDQKDCPEITA